MTQLLDPADRFGVAAPGAAPPATSPRPVNQPPPRHRSRWWWLLYGVIAVVLAGGGYFGGRLSAPGRGPVVVGVAHGLAAGSPVTAGQLRLVHVSEAPTGALTAIGAAIGRTATRDVPVGAVLTSGDVGPPTAYPRAGETLVGIDVKPGQAPAEGLQPGDDVVAVAQPQQSNGKPTKPVVLAFNVPVTDVHATHDGEAVTVLVPASAAVPLAAQAAAGNVALIRAPKP